MMIVFLVNNDQKNKAVKAKAMMPLTSRLEYGQVIIREIGVFV